MYSINQIKALLSNLKFVSFSEVIRKCNLQKNGQNKLYTIKNTNIRFFIYKGKKNR